MQTREDMERDIEDLSSLTEHPGYALLVKALRDAAQGHRVGNSDPMSPHVAMVNHISSANAYERAAAMVDATLEDLRSQLVVMNNRKGDG